MVNGNSRSFAGNRYKMGPNYFRNRIQISYASSEIILRSKVLRHHFYLTSASKKTGYTFDAVYSFFETDIT